MDIFNCNATNRSGVIKHSLFLIASLIVSIAIVFVVNMNIAQNEPVVIKPVIIKPVLKLAAVDVDESDFNDIHSNKFVPVEMRSVPVSHAKQQSIVENKTTNTVKIVTDVSVGDFDQNNAVTVLNNDEEPALTTTSNKLVKKALDKTLKDTAKLKQFSSKVIKISNFPVKDGFLSSGFGMRKHPIHGNIRMHSGIDIAAIAGSNVQAMGEGTVVFAGRKSGYGNNVDIKHGNTVITRYSHLREILVEVGQKVTPEDVIGLVGSTGVSTGPHLHLEVALNETEVDPSIFLAGKATVAAKPIVRQYAKTTTDNKLATNFDEATYQDYLQSFDGLYGLVVPGQTN
ncbi:M23 family metallopeptidase [Cocleimonas sp. KMM 6892]|uniref:M23 family metallopeptidase n=1 Tax=unclassified Cocleimonas TaxID=2639732 RepID=UPI002DBF1D27|nr:MULTISPECIES: M23 family metallopeptidase [unclassified Cocleimonas]MEB8432056.1 M23 family metallopeptidase [Cocleimonas sp. KMM 6892]MEC4714858.1 M23 family metallopeptidase [Cocleimonas sp. KMM 6895]MEC4744328.1 M23 family metallopeptidase [Cocleimonas sp. KMM 6896]